MYRKTGKDKKCLNCGDTFYAPGWLLRYGGGKYCSHECYSIDKKGFEPWNKGTKGLTSGNGGSLGPAEKSFIGDISEYKRIHYMVRKEFGNPEECSECKTRDKRIEWANKKGRYVLDIKEWIPLCKKCHFKYDKVESRRVKNARN